MSDPAEMQLIQDALQQLCNIQADDIEMAKGELGSASMYCFMGNTTGTEEAKAKAKARIAEIIQKLQNIHDGLCP